MQKDPTIVEPKTMCSTHVCAKCEKELYPRQWLAAIGISLIIFLPLLIVTGLSMLFDSELDPPYCYQEKSYGDITKRSFIECP